MNTSTGNLSRVIRVKYVRPPDRQFSFEMELVKVGKDLMIVRDTLEPREPIVIDGKLAIDAGDVATWFLLKGEPFDIARVSTPSGRFMGYYVDALEPVTWDGDDAASLTPLVDLFLDIWITPDLRYTVLDADELAEAETKSWISTEQSLLARTTIHRICSDLESGNFPPSVVSTYQ